jgi:hypothetical protein
MNDQHYLDDILVQLRKLKAQADKAVAQVADPQLFATLDAESNSIAVLMKHVAGNMRSRWTAFLTTDGETANRERDREFEIEGADTRANARVVGGRVAVTLDTISSLRPADLDRQVTVRGEATRRHEALHQLTHYRGGTSANRASEALRWRQLEDVSIPRGKSKEPDEAGVGDLQGDPKTGRLA